MYKYCSELYILYSIENKKSQYGGVEKILTSAGGGLTLLTVAYKRGREGVKMRKILLKL